MSEGPAGALDSRLLRHLFGTSEMRSVFSDTTTLKAWLKAEAALARAEAKLGVIPLWAGGAITKAVEAYDLDLEALGRDIETTQHPLVPVIGALRKLCGEAGDHVHWGATTQDIMDTGLVLQMREGLAIAGRLLDGLIDALAEKAREHRDTPISGRTHGQHAVPTTFGLKLAVLAVEFARHRQRLAEIRPRVLVGQLSGAAGTLATLGAKAAAVRAAMVAELGLDVPVVSWHTARDGIAETVSVLAMIGATCGKVGNEIVNLQRTEIAEVAELSSDASVGSSTLPQKRNPMVAQSVVSVARLMRGLPALALDAMGHEHERDMAAWQTEWAFVPEAFILASGALDQTMRIVKGLRVDKRRMAENLALTGGLINSEAVMMRLGEAVGLKRAKEMVTAATRECAATEESFAACLGRNEEVARILPGEAIAALLRPEAWLGEASEATEAALKRLRPE